MAIEMLIVAKFNPKLNLAQYHNQYLIITAVKVWENYEQLAEFNDRLNKVRSNTPFSNDKIFDFSWYETDISNYPQPGVIAPIINNKYPNILFELQVYADIDNITAALLDQIHGWLLNKLPENID